MWFRRGSDGLTNRERKAYAAEWRKVADAPVSLSTRILVWARGEGYKLTPWQESLIRNMFDGPPK